jgi:hypothetical protein
MARCIADASALVSLGIVTGEDPDPLALCLARYEVVVPVAVIEELQESASCDDSHGRAATTVLDRSARNTVIVFGAVILVTMSQVSVCHAV